MTIRETIRFWQDMLCRLYLGRVHQRVNDTIGSWSSRPVQPGPTLGELGLTDFSNALRRVVMSPTYLREETHAVRRVMYHGRTA